MHRISAVDACKWVTKTIPHAPYVTSVPWISHYGCKYVVHGDDTTSDSSGEDCYRFVKAAGRFKVVKRTPNISTTDLVGRMLLCSRSHFIRSLDAVLAGREGGGGVVERVSRGKDMSTRINEYASDASGLAPSSEVWSWTPAGSKIVIVHPDDSALRGPGSFLRMTAGKQPQSGQRIVYVDGGFDLFSSGHIEFLRRVVEAEKRVGEETRRDSKEYAPAYVVAGIHDDAVINHFKGVNYPIMNIFERGLCVLQCKVCA